MSQSQDKNDANVTHSTISTTSGPPGPPPLLPSRSPTKGFSSQSGDGGGSTGSPMAVGGAASSLAPAFRVSFDLCLTRLLNVNTMKIRESGEWTLLVKVFFLTDNKVVAASDFISIGAVVSELALLLPISLDMTTYGDVDTLVHCPLVVNL